MTPAGRRSIEFHLANATPRPSPWRLTWKSTTGALVMIAAVLALAWIGEVIQ